MVLVGLVTLRMILGDFPPSSRVTLLRVAAASDWIILPTSVDPVNATCTAETRMLLSQSIAQVMNLGSSFYIVHALWKWVFSLEFNKYYLKVLFTKDKNFKTTSKFYKAAFVWLLVLVLVKIAYTWSIEWLSLKRSIFKKCFSSLFPFITISLELVPA